MVSDNAVPPKRCVLGSALQQGSLDLHHYTEPDLIEQVDLSGWKASQRVNGGNAISNSSKLGIGIEVVILGERWGLEHFAFQHIWRFTLKHDDVLLGIFGQVGTLDVNVRSASK